MAEQHENARKEKVREGLEIDYDLLDSDLLRCYVRAWMAWRDGPVPHIVWVDHIDRDGWVPGKELEARVMSRTLDDENEIREGLRFLRLQRWTSYACLQGLARRPPEPGVFVIRKPPNTFSPVYVCKLDETTFPEGLGDPELPDGEKPDLELWTGDDITQAMHFSHAEAIRLTIRIMQALGRDLPGEHGDYYEPVRLDIAEELHARAVRRPRPPAALRAVLWDLSREPQE